MNAMIYDAVIIGAGPAGASCAVWLSLLGFKPIIIDRASTVGGLCALNPFPDPWNITAPDLTGEEVSVQIKKSLESARVPVLLEQMVKNIQREEASETLLFKVFFEDKEKQLHAIRGRNIVIASGVKHKRPVQMKENERYPNILLGPGKHVYKQDFVMKKVAILGGGDNALENAVYVMDRGVRTVDIYARSIRAQKKWLNSINPKQLHIGEYEFDPDNMCINGEKYEIIMVFYGYEPQLDGITHLNLKLKEMGYIWTEEKTAQSSIPGIYAIGESANRMHPCVVTSMADGIVAAKAIQRSLEGIER
ncbi:NAD(P)/FAD-dependent oxidoreductase [Pelistega ratti]|uniref:NAD(P)/FAD-dependent oxidoreductase n=1 Tax=Pelistega ratti TaxID=2652177 RepID=UPI001359F1DF|nr:NAD(P)/FAD-dependent oxidoreductase [Pelistega ratti]